MKVGKKRFSQILDAIMTVVVIQCFIIIIAVFMMFMQYNALSKIVEQIPSAVVVEIE